MKKLSEIPYDARSVRAAIAICQEPENIHTPARRIAVLLRERLPVIRDGPMTSQDVRDTLEAIAEGTGAGAAMARRALEAIDA